MPPADKTTAAHILIVDDDPMIREILATIITALGHTLALGGDGLEAVALLEQKRFDVVITDMLMPNMDGMELLKHVKAAYPGIDVLVITGHSDTYMYTSIIEAGGSDFITKPFEADELQAKLNRILREQRLIRSMEKEIAERKKAEERLLTAKLQIEEANKAKDVLITDLFGAMDEMLGNRDHYTFEHALRVAELSKRIGRYLELSADEVEVLERACLVHDIGKVAIPDDVLLKPGRFDRQDRHIMQVHPLVGANLFAKRHHDPRISFIIRHHHERLDGSGYPSGLHGDELGIMVRIVAVADVYEALVAKRPYKDAMDKEQALEILGREVSEGRLDGKVVRTLEEVLVRFDPLTITREMTADYMLDLEMFRRMTYFREPLSDFYNYRYLYFLDDAKLLGKNERPFQLLVANFLNMEDLHRQMGPAVTDQIVDDLGQKFFQTVECFNESCSSGDGSVQLFRKGSDYLLYSDCPDDLFSALLKEIKEHLDHAEKDWQVKTGYYFKRYEKGYPLERALNELFVPMGEA